MNELNFICDYKRRNDYRQSFNSLANKVFGIDFEKWYEKGFWNDRYICYSFADNGRIVSNVSISKIDLIINGAEKKATQIGTVMTLAEYRNRGLAKKLMNKVLTDCADACDLIFLFANNDSASFYTQFGFDALKESEYFIEIEKHSADNNGGVRRLDISNRADALIIEDILSMRLPVSKALGVKNAQHIFNWYCCNVFKDNLYLIDDPGIITAYNIKDNILNIYDILCREKILFYDVLKKIATKKVDKVIFHFMPDFHDLQNIKCNPLASEDVLFVKPSSKWNIEKFKYPMTAQA